VLTIVNFSYKVELTRADVNRTSRGEAEKKAFHHRVRRGAAEDIEKTKEKGADSTGNVLGWAVVLWERNFGRRIWMRSK
jgi:hypothetical protein